MAAAYAALVSLGHIIEQIMDNQARRPIFSDKQHIHQIKSLKQKVNFLCDFLEVYSHEGSNEAQRLESRIANAAYAAEDVIESHVVDTILSQAPNERPKRNIMFDVMKSCFSVNEKNSSDHLSQGLKSVIENIDSIWKEVMEVKEKSRGKDPQRGDVVVSVVSFEPPRTGKDTMMEYYDEDLEQIMNKLTGQSSNLQIIPIVGMGGIGKTTFARNVYDNPLIVECFDIRAWVTISQEYSLPEILLCLLNESGVSDNKREQESGEYHQLGLKLHKRLLGRKYLIIIDDIWSIDAWEKLRLFLPDNGNGSRVMVTTRFSNVAYSFGSSHLYQMIFLDEKKSWTLLCRKVFGHDSNCPLELEKIGKDIAKNCKGLPLSIVVIGGLLAKSEMTPKYWEYVAKYLNKIINSEGNGHWLKISYLSYTNLPIHLKPCFLYFGVYPEDSKIRVSELIKLWVAEGFLKPDKSKSLEEVAEDYLKDLIERNLIFVCELGSVGKMKTCTIHDLLRDLCLKEAQKDMFLCVSKVQDFAQSVNNKERRRLVFHEGRLHELDPDGFGHALQSAEYLRSFRCFFFDWVSVNNLEILRLLRVYSVATNFSLETNILRLVNLRYLECEVLLSYSTTLFSRMFRLPYLLSQSTTLFSPKFRLPYLQTLILKGYTQKVVPSIEIWEMPQLRHLISRYGIHLLDPLRGQMDGQDDTVLENLQTLSFIINFKCTEEVLRRIPNIKKLSMQHSRSEIEKRTSNYHCLHNLSRLHKLQSLSCNFQSRRDLFQNVSFPQSLNKLTLSLCSFEWDGFTETVGSLPHLEKLRVQSCSTGAEWNSVEGKFIRLKFLEISYCNGLECWTAESDHFPGLERLVLILMLGLKEIPSGFGETLKSIVLDGCRSSVIATAEEILEEQKSFGNEGLRLTVSRTLQDSEYMNFQSDKNLNRLV